MPDCVYDLKNNIAISLNFFPMDLGYFTGHSTLKIEENLYLYTNYFL